MKNITPRGSGFYVRVYRQGQWHCRLFPAEEEAVAWRDSLGPPGTKAWTTRKGEHQRQLKLLPPGTSMRNIVNKGNGYIVKMKRHGKDIYGGFYSGPRSLLRAVKKRDLMETKHPSNR